MLKVRAGVPVAAYLDEGYLEESGLTERISVGGRTVGVLKNGVFQTVATDLRGTVLAETTGVPRLASPFGQRDVHTGLSEAIEYVEKGYDADLGLVRMGARDYDPETGRFTTPDPLFLEKVEKCLEKPKQANLFGYAQGDPLGFGDPSGLAGEPNEQNTSTATVELKSPTVEAPTALSISPVAPGGRLTSPFGYRTPPGGTGSATQFHPGQDVGPKVKGAQDQVFAPVGGDISIHKQNTTGGAIPSVEIRASIPESWAMCADIKVTIRHVDSSVSAGKVEAGQVVGQMATAASQGTYGGGLPFSTGPHDHVEVRINGVLIDPLLFLGSTLNGTQGAQLSRSDFAAIPVEKPHPP